MNYQEKELIIFDLDGTLADSKAPLDNDMADLVIKLLERKKVAVISGGTFSQFEKQFLSNLPASTDLLKNLFLLPTTGTRLYAWRDSGIEKNSAELSAGWHQDYSENISPEDRNNIIKSINETWEEAGYRLPEQIFGERIEDRESQVTFSALGQEAPLDLKKAWDPDKSKRQRIVSILKDKIPHFDVSMGGSTSVDVTMRGVNKAYGVNKLSDFLKIPIDKMLFIGDEIIPSGNDYSVKEAGVDCINVSGKRETEEIIKELL
jgi:HAD superfamily hydrolase (TIGR01484 family)